MIFERAKILVEVSVELMIQYGRAERFNIAPVLPSPAEEFEAFCHTLGCSMTAWWIFMSEGAKSDTIVRGIPSSIPHSQVITIELIWTGKRERDE